MGGGRYVMDVLTQRVVEAGVQVIYNARAQALIADGAREVHGLVLRIDGQERFARARRAVVLCAGGFVMNREMVKQHAPFLLRSQFPLGTVDDGSGILLGASVGGAMMNMSEGFATIPWYPPGSLVKGIFVNSQGQRFINEDCYHGRVSNYIMRQSGDRIWLLQDHATYAMGEMQQLAKMEIGAAGETWEEVERELQLPADSLSCHGAPLQPLRRPGHRSAVPQGAQVAEAAERAAVRGDRLPHRPLLLRLLHPGRSRQPADRGSGGLGSQGDRRPVCRRAAPPAACPAGARATARACRWPMRRSSAARRASARRPPRASPRDDSRFSSRAPSRRARARWPAKSG